MSLLAYFSIRQMEGSIKSIQSWLVRVFPQSSVPCKAAVVGPSRLSVAQFQSNGHGLFYTVLYNNFCHHVFGMQQCCNLTVLYDATTVRPSRSSQQSVPSKAKEENYLSVDALFPYLTKSVVGRQVLGSQTLISSSPKVLIQNSEEEIQVRATARQQLPLASYHHGDASFSLWRLGLVEERTAGLSLVGCGSIDGHCLYSGIDLYSVGQKKQR